MILWALFAAWAVLAVFPQGCRIGDQLLQREQYKPILASPRPTPAASPSPAPSNPRATPTPTPAAEVTRPGNPAAWGEEGRIGVGREFDAIYFNGQETELDTVARQRVTAYVEWLRAHPRVWITLAGHADRHNTLPYAYNLGMARAAAVADAMIGLGLESRRIYSTSFGKDRLAAEGTEPRSDALNSRVEVLGFVAPHGQDAPAPAGVDKAAPPAPDAPPPPHVGKELTR